MLRTERHQTTFDKAREEFDRTGSLDPNNYSKGQLEEIKDDPRFQLGSLFDEAVEVALYWHNN